MGHCRNQNRASGSMKSTLLKSAHCKNNRASGSKRSTPPSRALQKINLPQGHRNRPHKSRHPIRGKSKSCLRVNEIDPIEVSALQKIIVPQGQNDRPHQKKRTAKNKFASRSLKSTLPTKAPSKGKNQKNPKESLKTEGQKAIPYIQESKLP